MQIILPGLLACAFYIAATILQVRSVLDGRQFNRWVRILGGLAIVTHGMTTFQAFFGHDGQGGIPAGIDVSIYPMLTLMALTIVVIVMLSSLRRPVDNLFIVIFPVALATVAMELFLEGEAAPRDDITSGILAHITLSVAAYSLLTIAAAQALVLSFGDNLLRHHRLAILRNLPPLQTMEHLMFEMLWAGILFLTLSIATGFVFLEDLSGPGLVHHTVITLAAWVVFAVLMWGRYQLGWRGAIASRWTLAGFVLLALGYFGSKVVLELILGQS